MQNYQFGINFAAHITGDFGLAEAARGTIKAIEAANIPFSMTDLKVQGQPNSDRSYTDFDNNNPYPVNLIYTNPNWVERIFEGYFEGVGQEYFQGKYNIGVWLWELPVFPQEWNFALELFEEIWAPSNFTVESIAAVSPVPVLKIGTSLQLPLPKLDRETLGLPKDKFIFLFMFDFGSSFERKNPLASIEAFKQAFSQSNKEVALVLKFYNSDHFPHKRERLKTMTEGWPSIYLIDKHLTKQEVHGLIKNCDCYVSLHRAEGFGLTQAEAMFYGKPLIATAYSSTMEFTNVGNSFLVKYDLVETEKNYGPYPKGSIWAEPDVDHASSLMRYVWENPKLAQKVGTKASLDIRKTLDAKSIGHKIKQRLEYIISHTDYPKSFREVYQLHTEKAWFTYQAEAWKQTAKQVQMELQKTHSEVINAQMELERLQTLTQKQLVKSY